jgi:hypothetical protein
MVKTKKPTWYYIGGCFFTFGVIANLISENGKIWLALIWGILSVFLFYIANKKNKEYKVEAKIELEHETKTNTAFSKLKDFYELVLKNERNINQIEQVILDLVNSENLTNELLKEISEKAAKSVVDDIVSKETYDGNLSPDGYNNIFAVAKKINVDLKFDKNTENIISKLRLNWDVDYGDLPIINTSISLQKGEICYFQRQCQWLENKTVTKSIAYSGVTGSFKIAKGVRYRVGNIKLQRITTESLVIIDRGTVFVTNKRIIFMGVKNNSNIKYSAILSIVPYSDAVCIEKDSGKSPYLKCSDAELLSRILVRLNNE